MFYLKNYSTINNHALFPATACPSGIIPKFSITNLGYFACCFCKSIFIIPFDFSISEDEIVLISLKSFPLSEIKTLTDFGR